LVLGVEPDGDERHVVVGVSGQQSGEYAVAQGVEVGVRAGKAANGVAHWPPRPPCRRGARPQGVDGRRWTSAPA
jgi:hypothetical protein